MHPATIVKILGLLLMLFSLLGNLPPLLVSLIYSDGSAAAFLYSIGILFSTGLMLWLITSSQHKELSNRDGFMVVTLFWAVLGTAGCLPLLFSPATELSLTDAVFESISGLTTTGATVISGLDELPESILFYRQLLQWLGGMGIIVLAVALLPMLGIGGMQLYRAESPGPVKDTKLVPRLAETAKSLWLIYLTLTLICALAYWAVGMSLFDAVSHSFSTVAIGGFSTHDSSLAYFDSPLVESIAIVFMVIAGINFALHFFAFQKKQFRHYLHDPEFKFYAFILCSVSIVTVLVLTFNGTYDSFWEALRRGVFQVVSFATTTGFATADFNSWPLFLPYVLLYAAIIGACAGSTGGGMKVIRILLIFKQGFREVQRLIHPRAVIPIKLGKKVMSDRVVESVWGFFAVYVMAFMVMLLALLATGLDIITAFSAVGACINNLGPGLSGVAETYGALPGPAKWILCLAMLLGRLEVFTLLVLFTPMFWKR
ncbi:MAG: potassium transporter [OM182 bacterium]|jgi:trk system potassium uptake protein TrkH|uniref:Trk system potassium uptake protein n=1 Tax=OM182 bacterium TaxID=2510334 RepID=A0A520RXC6_9GAMM|nr:MAG: potassium transporter [Gammaproteobacteria bacterium TMED163]RZO74841.1 MAG: potassium transporter [OM182 bacterium]|tara:strand:- start:1028 stop:2482 length:1455 start_codon:yes stop_codon:yes gene_type:complete